MILLILLSCGLMLLDQRSPYFQQVQSASSVVALPFRYLVNLPVSAIEWMNNSITSQQQVLEENAKLRAQQLLLAAKLQRLIALENENAQLRALLQSSPHVGGRFTTAQLLAVSMDPFVQKVVLDKGKSAGIYVGQPVLDAYGIMGQVVKIGPLTSEILLLTDPQSAVPVQDSRNGVRAIAVGMGNSNTLQLVNVLDSADVQVGDAMVSSGLDQRFPTGYPVGTVVKVNRDPELRFATIILQPSARLDRSREVLLVWPLNATQPSTTPSPPPTSTPRASSANATENAVPVADPNDNSNQPSAEADDP